MDYRQYDNAIGRFNGIDRLAETTYSFTPYQFAANNPVYFNDPTGLSHHWPGGTAATNIGNMPNWAAAMWVATPDGSNSYWANDGSGNFDNTDGSGFVNSHGEYYMNVEMLEGVSLNYGGTHNNALMLQDYVYKTGRFYQSFRDKLASENMDNVQSALDYLGAVPVLGEVFDGANAGISAFRGDYASAGLSVAAMVPIWGWAATGLKQSHHIIPKAVYKNLISDIGHLVERDGIKNLMDLPVPFHGNHPQYSKYVKGELEYLKSMGDLSAGSIEALQSNLRGMINEAMESGQKLNDYFRPLVR